MIGALLKDRFAACVLALVALELWLQCFRIRNWEHAGYRILLLGVIAAGLALLPRLGAAALPAAQPSRQRLRWLAGLAAVLLLWDGVSGFIAIKHTVQTGDIRMDQGQSTLKAAQGLWHGENPYGEGALLDPYGYMARLDLRIAAGVGPHDVGPEVEPMLWHYWATHDPDLRARLLPPPPDGAGADAARETAILGYKYGPVPLIATALMAPALGPLAVTATNVGLTFALYGLVWLILRESAMPLEFAALAFNAVLADHYPVWYYMHFSDSDVWPLTFCALAVLAAMRGLARRGGRGAGAGAGVEIVPLRAVPAAGADGAAVASRNRCARWWRSRFMRPSRFGTRAALPAISFSGPGSCCRT